MLFSQSPIAERAQSAPDSLAVIAGDNSYSNKEYHDAISSCAATLEFSPGERIGIHATDSFEMLCLLHALLRRGMVAIPISPRLPPDKIAPIAKQLELTALYTDQESNTEVDIPTIQLSTPQNLNCQSALPTVHSQQPTPLLSNPELGLSSEALAKGETQNPELPAIMVLTSGSTSKPKAVVHTRSSLAHNARGANENMPLGAGDRWLLSLPLHHVSGLGILFRTAISGAVIVLDDRPDAADAMREHKITHVSMVTSQLQDLINSWEAQGPIQSLKAVLVGGSSIPSARIAHALGLGIPLHLSYGSTEMGSQITTTPVGANQKQMTTSGKLLSHREMTLTPEGEILVKGQTLCSGYWHDGRIHSCVDEQGWFHSGDNGQLDEEGYLTVLGRRDSMFISGGENIYPEEIEAALMALPTVTQAAVVAIRDATYGQRPIAFIQTTEAFAAESVRNALASTLPRFKLPDTIHPWPTDYPRGTLKTDRVFLKTLITDASR